MKYRDEELKKRLLEEGVVSFGYSLVPKIVLEDHRLHPASKLIYLLIFSTLAEGNGTAVDSSYICSCLDLSQKEYVAGIEDLLENGYLYKNQNNSVTLTSNPLHMAEINFRKAMEQRDYWLEHKEQYVICDTEGTANRANELVEISMIDLDGKVLYDSLIHPATEISHRGIKIHGITNEMVADAPTWEEAWPQVRAILDGRIMIAFDSLSDVMRIKKTSALHNVSFGPIRHECLQKNVMLERNLKQALALYLAAGEESQNHRALDDCYLCLDIIKRRTTPPLPTERQASLEDEPAFAPPQGLESEKERNSVSSDEDPGFNSSQDEGEGGLTEETAQ